MKSAKGKDILIDSVFVLLGAMILCYWMWFNGFVFFYGDSGGYITRSFNGQVSHHWAMFYSLFIKLTSLSWSLIGVAVAQNIIISWLIFRLIRLIVGSCWHNRIALVSVVLILNFSSTLPWISNMMMSDVFTGVGMSSLILLFYEKMKGPSFWFALLLFVSGVIAHKSHKPIIGIEMLILSCIYLIYVWKFSLGSWKDGGLRIVIIWTAFFLGLMLLVPAINTMMAREEVIKKEVSANESLLKTAKSEYHFVWRALQRVGVYDEMLEEYCPTRQYVFLCDKPRMDRLGEDGYWNDLKKGGLLTEEVEDITKAAMMDSEYIIPVISEGFNRGMKMSRNYRIPIRHKSIRSPKRLKSVFRPFSQDEVLYKNSCIALGIKMMRIKQMLQKPNGFILRFWIIFYLILLVLIRITIWKNVGKERLWNMFFVSSSLIGGYYINCFLMATFGNLGNPRYPTRVSWMVILGLLLLSAFLVDGIYRKKQQRL